VWPDRNSLTVVAGLPIGGWARPAVVAILVAPDPAPRSFNRACASASDAQTLNSIFRSSDLGKLVGRVTEDGGEPAGIGVNESLVLDRPWLLHRHRRFWDKLEAFDPSRFLPDAPTTGPFRLYAVRRWPPRMHRLTVRPYRAGVDPRNYDACGSDRARPASHRQADRDRQHSAG